MQQTLSITGDIDHASYGRLVTQWAEGTHSHVQNVIARAFLTSVHRKLAMTPPLELHLRALNSRLQTSLRHNLTRNKHFPHNIQLPPSKQHHWIQRERESTLHATPPPDRQSVMGWTKQTHQHLQQQADSGDKNAADKLNSMRLRNRENKQRSNLKLKTQRNEEALQKMVSTAVERRLRGKKSGEESDEEVVELRSPPAVFKEVSLQVRFRRVIADMISSKRRSRLRRRCRHPRFRRRVVTLRGCSSGQSTRRGRSQGHQPRHNSRRASSQLPRPPLLPPRKHTRKAHRGTWSLPKSSSQRREWASAICALWMDSRG